MNEFIKSFISGKAVMVTPKNIMRFLFVVQNFTDIEWYKKCRPLNFNPFNLIDEEYCFIDCNKYKKYMLWTHPKNFKGDYLNFDDYPNISSGIVFDRSITKFLNS